MAETKFSLTSSEIDMTLDAGRALELVRQFCDAHYGTFEIEYTAHKDYGDHVRDEKDFVVTMHDWDFDDFYAKIDADDLNVALLKALALCLLQLEVRKQWQTEDVELADSLSASQARHIIADSMRRGWRNGFDLKLANKVRKALGLDERPDLTELNDLPKDLP